MASERLMVIAADSSLPEFLSLVGRKNDLYIFARQFQRYVEKRLPQSLWRTALGWSPWDRKKRDGRENIVRLSRKFILSELVKFAMGVFSQLNWDACVSELHSSRQAKGLLLDLGLVEKYVSERADDFVRDHEKFSKVDRRAELKSDLVDAFILAIEEFFRAHEELKNSPRSRKTRSDIAKAIERTASSAPNFEIAQGHLKYKPKRSTELIRERKSAASERYGVLKDLCARRQNEQPEFARVVDRYGRCLSRLRRDRGSYLLHLAGLEIESLIRINAKYRPSDERNPSLDGDLLFAAQSLIVAHAALIILFPDIARLAADMDNYLKQSEAIDALRDKVLDPVLEKLLESEHIFDGETKEITNEIRRLNEQERTSTPSRAITSSKEN
jgi:hypothetical protein